MLFATTKGCGIIRRHYAITSFRSYSCHCYSGWATSTTLPPQHRSLSTSNNLLAKRRKGFFSSNATSRSPQRDLEATEQQKTHHQGQGQGQGQEQGQEQGQKRKSKRSPVAKSSLRRVAVAAQRSKDGYELKRLANLGSQTDTKVPADFNLSV